VLKDGLLVTGAQILKEIVGLHMYEISFIIHKNIFVFAVKEYSMWNKKNRRKF
jgi:hypothetical protein